MRHVLIHLFALWMASETTFANQVDPPDQEANRTRLVLPIQPFVDLHQHVRATAAGDARGLLIDGFAAAVEAAQALEPLAWGLIEGNLLAARDATSLLAVCEQLPESIQRDGREIALRDAAVAYALELSHIEADFLRNHWPQRRDALEAARASLEPTLLAHEQRCFAHVIQAYAMDDPTIAIPLYLVTHAPTPGAVTYRTRRGNECIVAIADLPPLQLAEIVLHEASHALDVATMRQATALMQIRRSLQTAGVAPTDPRHRDIWHTIMFIQSAETIRRIVDPDHVDYGERFGYYARVGSIADIQRPIWRAYLDGELTLGDAIDRMVGSLLEPE